jgi:hypothetical protein
MTFLQHVAHAVALQTSAERRRLEFHNRPKINILKENFIAEKNTFKMRLNALY